MKALCVKSYADLQQLVAGQIPTVEATLVERDVADQVANGHQQLVPYIVFYHMDVEAGKLKFIQTLKVGQGTPEEEGFVPGATSIGFGEVINEASNIVSSEQIVGENGETSYAMNLQNIMDTAVGDALATVHAQTGVDVVASFGGIIDPSQIAFFNSNVEQDALKVRIGIAIPVGLSAEQFEVLRTAPQLDTTVFQKLDTLGINVDLIIEQMDITPTIDNVVKELVEKYNLEAWSTMMFNYIARKELNEMMKDISYNDIVALVHAKRAAMQQLAQEAINTQQQVGTETAQELANQGAVDVSTTAPLTTEELDSETLEEDKPADTEGDDTPAHHPV